MITKLKFSIVVLLFTTLVSYSQNISEPFMNNVRFGGTFNLGFGNNFTTIGISPSAIYDFNQQFSAGLSLSYLYSKGKVYDPLTNRDYTSSSNIFGGSIITLYNPFNGVQLSAEFEQMNINYKSDFYLDETYWSPAIYLGVAYNTGNVSFGMRYDVLYNTGRSIYGSAFTPVFRVYF